MYSIYGNTSKINIVALKQLDTELTKQIKLFKIATLVFGLLIILVQIFRKMKNKHSIQYMYKK